MLTRHQLSRRCFLGSAAAAVAATVCTADEQSEKAQPAKNQSPPPAKGYPLVVPGYFGSQPGIQLGTQLPATASEDDMRFARQLGVEWVMTSLPPRESTLETYRAAICRF